MQIIPIITQMAYFWKHATNSKNVLFLVYFMQYWYYI